jgi:hypothetical protein
VRFLCSAGAARVVWRIDSSLRGHTSRFRRARDCERRAIFRERLFTVLREIV